jgi:hypothetical protein
MRDMRRFMIKDEFDRYTANTRHFVAVVRVPFFHCVACGDYYYCGSFYREDYINPLLHWRRKFSKETFQSHMREYGEIRATVMTAPFCLFDLLIQYYNKMQS